MSDDHKLQRAHQLSAQASALARPPDAGAETLQRAKDTYTEAAELFQKAEEAADEATRQTLRLLTAQHRKLARYLERRIAVAVASPSPAIETASPALPRSPVSPSFPEATVPGFPGFTPAVPGSIQTTGSSTQHPVASRRSSGVAVGLAAGRGGVLSPGLAVHATSAPRSVPPFSLRPVESSAVPSVALGGPGSPRSPLYSSSSSSEPPDESYLLPGAVPDNADPFSRFWGMLENMLEEISLPKALTAMDVAAPSIPVRPVKVPKDRVRLKSKGKERSPSPSESFYFVPHDRGRGDAPGPVPAGKASPAPKTNEELMLENESLRASLDALAVHAHSVEVANRTLKEHVEERDNQVRSVVSGVRREAQKARHDTEVMRSQLLASTMAPVGGTAGATHAALRKRILDLEEEARHLRGENESVRSQLDKFKEKWEKLKAKKEAKVAAAKARAPRSPGLSTT